MGKKEEKQEKLYKVFTPVKSFTGFRYGVAFKDGVGMATKHQAQVLVGNFGYSCPELKKEDKAETQQEAPKAEKASKDEK